MTQIDELTPDLARLRIGFVNVYFVGRPGAVWTLVDGGLADGVNAILAVAASRFEGRPPAAVILTHAHFDHVGALPALLRQWKNVPVYAHPLELPFLTGAADYPPLSPSVGTELLARLSALVPPGGTDLGHHLRVLPESDHVPFMEGWRWIHTPGQTSGHVSLFRESDRVLIAGDAVITSPQDSAFSVTTQPEALNGPPVPLTLDRTGARRSVAVLAALRPLLLATGHGCPMRGEPLAGDLDRLAREFEWRVRLHGPGEVARGSHPTGAPVDALMGDAPVAAARPALRPRRRPLRYTLFYAALAGAAAATIWMISREGPQDPS